MCVYTRGAIIRTEKKQTGKSEDQKALRVVLVWERMIISVFPADSLEVGHVCFWHSLPPDCSVCSSHHVILYKVALQDDVFHSYKDEVDVLRVGGACEVGVDDLAMVWVQVHKHLQDELPTS